MAVTVTPVDQLSQDPSNFSYVEMMFETIHDQICLFSCPERILCTQESGNCGFCAIVVDNSAIVVDVVVVVVAAVAAVVAAAAAEAVAAVAAVEDDRPIY